MVKVKKKLSTALILIFCTLLFAGCTKSGNIETVSPEEGTLETTVTETGTVVFDDEYTVTSLVSAKVLTADFEEGDSVVKGDILYTLDSVELRNQIEQTKVALEKAKEARRQAENASSDLKLYAKASGLVTKVYVHQGDYVQSGTPIAEIIDSDYMKLTIPFSLPSDISVYDGMSVKVIMTVNGAEVAGTVNKVYESGQSFDGGRHGTKIEIKIKNPGALKAGDTAYAEIGGISSLSSGTLENYIEQTVVASQSGEITTLNIREGNHINYGLLIMSVKNDSVANSLSNSRLNVKDIETTLSQLEDKLDDYVIKSPIDGVIITKTAKVGDIAASTAPLAVVADTGKLYVNADIDEMYIKDIWAGQKARVAMQNGEQTEYSGSVRRINDSGIERNGVTYYEVQIELENTEGLIEGMNMDITIVTGEKNNVMYLPRECVKGNKVTVLKNNKQEEKTVKTGSENDKYIEIEDGLEKDEKVIINGGAK